MGSQGHAAPPITVDSRSTMGKRFVVASHNTVRVPLQLKLTVPYFLLASIVALGALWAFMPGNARYHGVALSTKLRAAEASERTLTGDGASGSVSSPTNGAIFIPTSKISRLPSVSDSNSEGLQSVIDVGSAQDAVDQLAGTAYIAHAVLDDSGQLAGYMLLESTTAAATGAAASASVAPRELSVLTSAGGRADLANEVSGASDGSMTGQVQVLLVIGLGFLLVVVFGTSMARRITMPLVQVVDASTEVARGNLDVMVNTRGNDEVAILAHSFNQMISSLREGNVYRDLLGRTVSPEVRDQMRRSFAAGDLQLAGQEAVATVIFGDIRDFTHLSESVPPRTVLKWLNEYFGELVPIITANGGVVNKFDGDAFLAFFGVLPQPQAPAVSARQACLATQEMLVAISALNARRAVRGEPAFITGIGINTGPVTVGGLGAAGRLHYTVIGDTVNTCQRLEGLTRELGESAALLSGQTLDMITDGNLALRLEPMGSRWLRGKSEAMKVYRLHPTCPGTAL